MCRNMSKMPLGANFGAVFCRLVTDLVPFSRFGANVVTRFFVSDSRSFYLGATSGAVFLCLVPKVASFRRFGANCGTSDPADRLHFSLLGEGITIFNLRLRVKMERKRYKDMEKIQIPPWEKSMLTVEEAAAYSNIGLGKIRQMINNPLCPFVLIVGPRKKLIKRREFDDYLSKNVEI